MKLQGCLLGGVCATQTFKVILTKDCANAYLSNQALNVTSVVYQTSSAPQFVAYIPPVNSDPYCAIGYDITVQDNITSQTHFYTSANRFGSDPSTTATHADGVSRTESYLLQNMTSPLAGKHLIRIFTTTTVFADLNKFWRDLAGDTYLYAVNIDAYILSTERSTATRHKVQSSFQLKLESFCNNLIIQTSPILPVDYEIWQPRKDVILSRFTLYWPWQNPSSPYLS